MRVLIVDDMENRHEGIQRRLTGMDCTHAYSYDEAVAALTAEKFDAAFLDHDLGPDSGVPTKSGTDIARFIANLPVAQRPHTVVIHSWNREGAVRMGKILDEAGVENVLDPFIQGKS